MKKALLILTITTMLIFGCSCAVNEVSDPHKIYQLSDFSEIGWKQKKAFVTDFPQSDKAFWGYLKGHEVGLILYPSPKLANEYGIKAIIQPGGSINDKRVIDAANKAGIVMAFTGTRHFKH